MNLNGRGTTALITGANSGLGFETAYILAKEKAYKTIILGCRTVEKCQGAAKALRERLGSSDVRFLSLAIDVSDIEGTKQAVETLVSKRDELNIGVIDSVILNAGLVKPQLEKTPQDLELIVATSVFGHHILASELISAGLVEEGSYVVISSSEAARGTYPTSMMGMSVPDFDKLAKKRSQTLESLFSDIGNGEYFVSGEHAYAIAKVWANLWARAMAKRHPDITFLAISPGAVPDTNAKRNVVGFLSTMMKVMMKIGPSIGMSHSVHDGSMRYVDGLSMPNSDSGKFFTSPKGKLIGKATEQHQKHNEDEVLIEASYRALTGITGVGA